MVTENWITAHIHAYQFFVGATRILVPDNLKTGVIRHTRYEVVLNRIYQEMAEHYGTAIIPARPISPKDYPQNRIIFKISRTTFNYKAVPPYF